MQYKKTIKIINIRINCIEGSKTLHTPFDIGRIILAPNCPSIYYEHANKGIIA